MAAECNFVFCIAPLPDTDLFCTGSRNGEVNIWSIRKKIVVFNLLAHQNSVLCMQISVDRQLLFTGSEDKIVKVWRISDWECGAMEGHTGAVSCVCQREKYLITGGWDTFICVWDLESRLVFQKFKGGSGDIVSLISKEEHIIGASSDKTIKLWRFSTLELEFTFTLGGIIRTIVEVGKYIASTSIDRNIKIWDMKKKRVKNIITGHFAKILYVNISVDRRYVLTGAQDKTARVWDLRKGKQIRLLAGHTAVVRMVKISPANQYVVTVCDDETMRIWDFWGDAVKVCRVGTIMKDWKVEVVYVNDKIIVLVMNNLQYQVWDLVTGERISTFKRRFRLLLEFTSRVRFK